MDDNLTASLLIICGLLEKFNVRYLLVGGVAVALNGYYRLSVNAHGEIIDKPDIDIWYSPTYENYFNILKVLEDLGVNVTDFRNEQSPDPKRSFFKLNFDGFTFDVLPEIKSNIKFIEAYQRRETIEIEEIQIHFVSYADLISDKEASGRKKDIEDIRQLKRIRGED